MRTHGAAGAARRLLCAGWRRERAAWGAQRRPDLATGARILTAAPLGEAKGVLRDIAAFTRSHHEAYVAEMGPDRVFLHLCGLMRQHGDLAHEVDPGAQFDLAVQYVDQFERPGTAALVLGELGMYSKFRDSVQRHADILRAYFDAHMDQLTEEEFQAVFPLLISLHCIDDAYANTLLDRLSNSITKADFTGLLRLVSFATTRNLDIPAPLCDALVDKLYSNEEANMTAENWTVLAYISNYLSDTPTVRRAFEKANNMLSEFAGDSIGNFAYNASIHAADFVMDWSKLRAEARRRGRLVKDATPDEVRGLVRVLESMALSGHIVDRDLAEVVFSRCKELMEDGVRDPEALALLFHTLTFVYSDSPVWLRPFMKQALDPILELFQEAKGNVPSEVLFGFLCAYRHFKVIPVEDVVRIEPAILGVFRDMEFTQFISGFIRTSRARDDPVLYSLAVGVASLNRTEGRFVDNDIMFALTDKHSHEMPVMSEGSLSNLMAVFFSGAKEK